MHPTSRPVDTPDYIVEQQHNPSAIDAPAFCQPGFFFNEVAHLRQQTNDSYILLTAINPATNLAEARCALFLNDAVCISPAAAPFGSVEFAETLPDDVLDHFVDALVETAQQTTATTLRLVNYPTCYAPAQTARLTALLGQKGFTVAASAPTYYVPVTDEPFAYRVAPAEGRRLRKCRRAGFQFGQWHRPDAVVVTNFLTETRQLLRYRMTIAPDRLIGLLRTFPDQFSVFTVMDGGRIAALAVTVRVRADILYVFFPASHPDHRTFSPMVLLTDGLYTYCQQQGIRLLDFGLSLDGAGQPKPSLSRFKENLGGLTSPKLTFEKVF